MKRKFFLVVGGLAMGAAAILGTFYRQQTPQPRTICTYVDTNNNGEYDMYLLHKEDGAGSEPINLGLPFRIGFASPLSGSCIDGEFDRETLENMFNLYKYPDVDEIRFES